MLRLFSDMEYDQSIGGCCGEVSARLKLTKYGSLQPLDDSHLRVQIMVDRNQRSWRDPVVMSQVHLART